MTIANEMQELAATVGLPLTVASLTTLEARIAKEPFSRAYGAFLGEVVRLSNPAAIAWVEHDGTAALRAGGTTWYPLDKVQKFQRNGSADSIAAFASVVIGMHGERTPEQLAAGNAKDEKRAERARTEGRAFVAAPSVETLLAMTSGLSQYAFPLPVVQDMGLRASMFVPFLGEKPRGLGYKRDNPGGRAATWIADLVSLGVDSREETLTLLDGAVGPKAVKEVRNNAANARGLIELRAGVVDVARFTGKDRAAADGMWRALHTVVWIWFQAPAKLPFASLTPVFQSALAPTSPHLESALDVLETWVSWRERVRDIAPVVDALLVVEAAAEQAKPVSQAKKVLTTYTWAVVRGEAPEDPRVAAQVAANRARQR